MTTLRDLRKEIDLGFRVFQVLVPGVLFTPCLLSPLNNFLIPYLRESLLLVLFGQGTLNLASSTSELDSKFHALAS